MTEAKTGRELKAKILELTREYASLKHRQFLPGNDPNKTTFEGGRDT